MKIDETDLECPVSLRRFQHPKVLPCGHTLDLDSLLSGLQQCPLCMVPIEESPYCLPTNWTLVRLLGISVPCEKSPRSLHEVMKKTYLMPFLNVEWDRVCKNIRARRARGYDSFCYYTDRYLSAYPEYERGDLQTELSRRLTAHGFLVARHMVPITVCKVLLLYHLEEVIIMWNLR